MTCSVAAIVLAAGQSKRMGAQNKLLADMGGRPMVSHIVDTVLASNTGSVMVVVGHDSEKIEAALSQQDVRFVQNPDYEAGLSASLCAGIAAVPGATDGALILLGDMPDVMPQTINSLCSAFDAGGGEKICIPVFEGKRGNPIVLPRWIFSEVAEVSGDKGARDLIAAHSQDIIEVTVDDSGVLRDVDQPEDLREN